MDTIDGIVNMICTEAVGDILTEDSEEEKLPLMQYDCSSYFKDTCFKIVSNKFLVAESNNFLVIFRDFVNSIHSVWGENRGF